MKTYLASGELRTDRGSDGFIEYEVTEKVYLHRLTPTMRSKLRKIVETGKCPHWEGKAALTMKILNKATGVPFFKCAGNRFEVAIERRPEYDVEGFCDDINVIRKLEGKPLVNNYSSINYVHMWMYGDIDKNRIVYLWQKHFQKPELLEAALRAIDTQATITLDHEV